MYVLRSGRPITKGDRPLSSPPAERLQDLVGLREPSQLLLGEDQRPIDDDLEGAVTAFDQLDTVAEFILDAGRQTGGLWPVVSFHAISDRDLHGSMKVHPADRVKFIRFGLLI